MALAGSRKVIAQNNRLYVVLLKTGADYLAKLSAI